MEVTPQTRPIHGWLKKINLAWVPGPSTPLLESITRRLLECFRQDGHTVLSQPQEPPGVDVILTTAEFGKPVHYRDSLTLTARRRFDLSRNPTVFTLLHASPEEWDGLLSHLDEALAGSAPDPSDFVFPGMADQAYHTLFEQGKRGGSIMAAVRLIQSQAMSIRNIVVVGGQTGVTYAYTFDLVGAHPRTEMDGNQSTDCDPFFSDLKYRILTAASTHEITNHQVEDALIPQQVWRSLSTPRAMVAAGNLLGKFGFFTEMVKVGNLVDVPMLDYAIASQYSEGCYGTWEPELNALVATITGSARPVSKDHLSEDELAVITGLRADGQGARVRHVEGKRNDPPSSEAVEMVGVDEVLPKIIFEGREVPVARSKLHGHRSIRSFDTTLVEHVSLEPPYYTYPVSCSTEAQATAIRKAFSHSQALKNPSDPRKIIFTILPGHGVLILEKWVQGKAPFEIICDAIRNGRLEIENHVPQGPLEYLADGTAGRQVIEYS